MIIFTPMQKRNAINTCCSVFIITQPSAAELLVTIAHLPGYWTWVVWVAWVVYI